MLRRGGMKLCIAGDAFWQPPTLQHGVSWRRIWTKALEDSRLREGREKQRSVQCTSEVSETSGTGGTDLEATGIQSGRIY